jgi:opacity protein-like surface antigen
MRKRIVAFVFVLALVLVLAGTASAAVKQGDKELSFSGAYADLAASSDSGLGSVKVNLLSGSLGYFVSDEVELSAKGTGAWLKVSDEKLNLYGVGGDIKYHFQPSNSTVPYVGAQWNYLHGTASFTEVLDTKANGAMYGPLAGVKFFVTDSTILFVEYQYDIFTRDVKDAINHANIVCAGISFKF